MFDNNTAKKIENLTDQAVPLLDQVTEQASALLHSGVESVQDMSRQLREKALHASQCTTNYVKDEPVKAMLIAAATGAALMALVSLVSRTRDRH